MDTKSPPSPTKQEIEQRMTLIEKRRHIIVIEELLSLAQRSTQKAKREYEVLGVDLEWVKKAKQEMGAFPPAVALSTIQPVAAPADPLSVTPQAPAGVAAVDLPLEVAQPTQG